MLQTVVFRPCAQIPIWAHWKIFWPHLAPSCSGLALRNSSELTFLILCWFLIKKRMIRSIESFVLRYKKHLNSYVLFEVLSEQLTDEEMTQIFSASKCNFFWLCGQLGNNSRNPSRYYLNIRHLILFCTHLLIETQRRVYRETLQQNQGLWL